MITRRGFLAAGAALAMAGRVRAEDLPPIVFVHGDSDQAAVWQTTFWRFESNGYPRDKLFAISFTNPQARSDNGVEQASRSSTDDELKELSAFVDAALAKTGASKVALVANSRLSVQPVTDEEWAIVCELGGLKAQRGAKRAKAPA
mgnify:CR=1 FL=1